MNPRTQNRLASALIFLSLLSGTVNHLLGGRSLTTTMNYSSFGPIIYPTRFSIEIHGLGVVLVPLLAAGIVWWAILAVERLGHSKDRTPQSA